MWQDNTGAENSGVNKAGKVWMLGQLWWDQLQVQYLAHSRCCGMNECYTLSYVFSVQQGSKSSALPEKKKICLTNKHVGGEK